MTTNSVQFNIDDAVQRLETCGDALSLDFSTVERLDTSSLAALERLSEAARGKGVKVSVHGAPVSVYRVLKLARLGFSF